MLVRSLAAAALALSLLPLSEARAEPQILALISTETAKPLTCDGTECFAEFSAFCMEPGRAGPDHDSPYALAEGAALTLLAFDAAGNARKLAAPRHARFQSQRGYAAVRISVPETALDAIGATRVSIAVGPRVVLLPVPGAKYHREHEPEQIAAAVGPNRIVGETLVDNGGEKAAAARLLNSAINALPERAPVSRETRMAAWQSAITRAPEPVREQGHGIAEDVYENCLDNVADKGHFTFRQCLQHGHDRTMWLLNSQYWKAVGPQS